MSFCLIVSSSKNLDAQLVTPITFYLCFAFLSAFVPSDYLQVLHKSCAAYLKQASKISPMNPNDTLHCLEASWQRYLKKRGHYIYQGETYLPVIRSRNDKKAQYRWLLLVSKLPVRRLSKFEQAATHQHLRQAEMRKEATYLVVGFVKEPNRIVVLPASAALRAGHIRSDKGGIAWED